MKYRPGIDKLMNRMQSFYDSDSGGALIQVNQIASLDKLVHVDLRKWSFPNQLYEYLE